MQWHEWISHARKVEFSKLADKYIAVLIVKHGSSWMALGAGYGGTPQLAFEDACTKLKETIGL